MAFLALTSGQCDADSPLDETLFQLIRTDFDDHESRIGTNESLSDGNIRDDFVGTAIDTDTWDTGGTTAPAQDGQPDHWMHLNEVGGGGTFFSAIAASTKRIRFDLDRDHKITWEMRFKSGQSDATQAWIMGFQDSSIAATVKEMIATDDNVICFRQGTNANTFKARCVKATAGTTLQDNIGNAANWTKLKIIITFSGATKQIQFFVDDVETSGSPFTDTIKIPLVEMRPVFGLQGGAAARHIYGDYILAYWNARPLSN